MTLRSKFSYFAFLSGDVDDIEPAHAFPVKQEIVGFRAQNESFLTLTFVNRLAEFKRDRYFSLDPHTSGFNR